MDQILNGRWLLLLAVMMIFGMGMKSERIVPLNERGGLVRWARLKTSGKFWDRHSQKDPDFISFISKHTNLNIEPRLHTADTDKVEELCNYPFIFSDGLHALTPAQLKNLREYLLRGGFLFIDMCIYMKINPSPDAFLQNQKNQILSILPNAKFEALTEDHRIFFCYFEMKKGLPRSNSIQPVPYEWKKHVLYRVIHEDRTIAIMGLSGLQCGWDGRGLPGNDVECMKMMVNIYIFAMTH
jgi:hypothetical protein